MAVNSPRRRWFLATGRAASRRAGLRTLVTSATLLLGAAAQAGPCASLEPARWLLGAWVADGGKRIVTETWTEASSTTFEGQGVTRDRTDGSVVDGEALRLVAMGGRRLLRRQGGAQRLSGRVPPHCLRGGPPRL